MASKLVRCLSNEDRIIVLNLDYIREVKLRRKLSSIKITYYYLPGRSNEHLLNEELYFKTEESAVQEYEEIKQWVEDSSSSNSLQEKLENLQVSIDEVMEVI